MTEYAKKIVQDLKPQWYLALSKTDKLEQQKMMLDSQNEKWNNKPKPIHSGTILIARKTKNSLSEGQSYTVLNHFCTLVTTLYGSQWNQFVTVKCGWTIKVNLTNFEDVAYEPLPQYKKVTIR